MQGRWHRAAGWFGLICLASGVAAASDGQGPVLWRVGLDDHELVVLGSLVPLPKDVRWNQTPMAAHLAESDVLLEPPGIDLQGGASWLGTFWRLPTLLRARNNPDELTLDEVLPPALLQRWERQRAVYLSGQQGINRRRPIVAADALQQRAMEIHGLELDNQIADQVSRLARRRGVTRVETTLPVALDTVNAFLDSVARQPLDDQACFETVLARVEAGPERLYAQAESWRNGNLSELQAHPRGDTFAICSRVLLAHPAARAHGIDDLPQRARARWLALAERTLQRHRRSVAVLPLSLVLGESGYLAELQRRGFAVDPPVLAPQGQARTVRLTQR
jgi:hypothetical protein